MKIKCKHCSNTQEIILDAIIFDDETEEVFVSYLAADCQNLKAEMKMINHENSK